MNAPVSRITPELRAAILELLAEEQSLNAPTLNELWDPYLGYKRPRLRPRSIAAMTSRMKPVLAALGDRVAAGITFEDADALTAEMTSRNRKRQPTPVTRSHAAQCLQCLITLLKWAVQRRLLKENPLNGYEAAVPCNRRDRVFTLQEIDAILDAAKRADCDEAFVFVSVMRDSGIRPIELLLLDVEHVDLRKGLLRVPASIAKTGVERCVPLAAMGTAALKAYAKRKKPTDRLFTCCYSTVSDQWRTCCEIAMIAPNKDRTPPLLYSLRHSTATRLAQLGWAPFELAQWMGWSNVQQAATYVKTTEAALLSSARKLDAANAATTSSPPAKKNRSRKPNAFVPEGME